MTSSKSSLLLRLLFLAILVMADASSGRLTASPVRQPEAGEGGSCASLLGQLFAGRAGSRYRLIARDQGRSIPVGEGRLSEDGRKGRLDFFFQATLPGGRELRGRVVIEAIRGCRLRLRSEREGERPMEEVVLGDAFLAQNHILHFTFDGGRRFFQLDRKGSDSRMITEYGLLLLQPVP